LLLLFVLVGVSATFLFPFVYDELGNLMNLYLPSFRPGR
jgi:hypothetical protein